jgi:hypothetical protein
MLETKESGDKELGDSDQVAPSRTDKKLIALAWVIACTVFFLMVRH